MSDSERRVVFMGSPDFAVPTLDALYGSVRYRPVLVVSQPDRPRGRGQVTVPTAVRSRALEHGIPTREMSRENYDEVVAELRVLAPHVVVVVAFGIIVKADLLELPEHGCVNVHGSLLPAYRGVSPIQAALLAGEAETGCTTMRMDEGIDTGDLLLSEATDILPEDTAGSLSDRLSVLGAHLLVRTLDGIFDGSITPRPQPESTTPYTKKIRKRHGHLDWGRTAVEVERRIRAMTPWPSAYTFVDDRRIIILEAAVGEESGVPGTILSLDPLRVACGEGSITLLRIKPEGGRAMTPEAFLAGHSLDVGQTLGDRRD